MAIAAVDGELLLCARAGLCPPEHDPVVVTEGITPTDGPELLLVRGSPDGRTVEVRHIAEFDGG